MAERVVELLGGAPPGLVVDATVGGGGHAEAILRALPAVTLLGIDQDADALALAAGRLAPFEARVALRQGRFDRLAEIVRAQVRETGGEVSGVLFDLGVSSMQLDRPERGFSYRHDAPLDMRMDQRQPTTAADLVNELGEAELAALLRRFGDERFSSRIARAIVGARPLSTTGQLAEVVRSAIPAPARRTGGHPAKRTFQALRIAVNSELAVLPGALDAAISLLAPGGRCLALAYHSGEDRVVKERFRHHASGGWAGPAGLPSPPGLAPTVRLLKQGAWKPSAGEIAANPRAASARLRAVEKLGATP